jgi:hypothetical protein
MAGEVTAGLRRGAVGLREVLFQSITAMAPAAAVAASIPSGAALAGGSLPLSVVIDLDENDPVVTDPDNGGLPR